MVNILVPTDFSPRSVIAVKYAVRIANILNGNITLLNVVDFQRAMRNTIRREFNARQLVRSIRDDMERLIIQISDELTVKNPPKFKISQGNSFSDTILKESRRLRTGLIVMGTKGASGLRKTLMGSNTVSVLGQSHIPVLVVPEKAEFKTFRNVIYATDLKDLEGQLKVLIPLIEKFGSTIHILHIVEHGDIEALEQQIEEAVARTGYKNIVTLVTVDQDIEGAIGNYISVSKADLVTLFTHKPSFYEKLMDKSVTRKLAFHSKIPLLAFRT